MHYELLCEILSIHQQTSAYQGMINRCSRNVNCLKTGWFKRYVILIIVLDHLGFYQRLYISTQLLYINSTSISTFCCRIIYKRVFRQLIGFLIKIYLSKCNGLALQIFKRSAVFSNHQNLNVLTVYLFVIFLFYFVKFQSLFIIFVIFAILVFFWHIAYVTAICIHKPRDIDCMSHQRIW